MKKIITLLAVTLLTGCSATYDININKDSINDNIKIYTDSKIIKNATEDEALKFSEKIGEWERGYDYYQREIYTTDKITGYEYTYDFKYEEYDAMSQIRKCYKDFEFIYEKNTITINTSKEFLCKNYYKDVNKLELNISSEYEIINSNADSKSNNIHTWNINSSNYKNKPISITITKSNIVNKEQNNKKNKINIQNILVLIIFILLIIVLIIRQKDKKQN